MIQKLHNYDYNQKQGLCVTMNKILDEYQKADSKIKKDKVQNDLIELEKKAENEKRIFMRNFSPKSEAWSSNYKLEHSHSKQKNIALLSSQLFSSYLLSPKSKVNNNILSISNHKKKLKKQNHFNINSNRNVLIGYDNDKLGRMTYLKLLNSTNYKPRKESRYSYIVSTKIQISDLMKEKFTEILQRHSVA